MTKEWFETTSCPQCGYSISTEQPIKAWIRTNGELDSRKRCLCVGDSDLWVHRYGTRTGTRGVDRSVQYLMLVEIKTHGGELDAAQRDTLWIVDQILRTSSRTTERYAGRFSVGHRANVVGRCRVQSQIAGRSVTVLSYGVHKLRLSGSTPLDSEVITWDNKPIDRSKLELLLRFDLHPDSLNRMEHRSHKRVNTAPTLPFEES